MYDVGFKLPYTTTLCGEGEYEFWIIADLFSLRPDRG